MRFLNSILYSVRSRLLPARNGLLPSKSTISGKPNSRRSVRDALANDLPGRQLAACQTWLPRVLGSAHCISARNDKASSTSRSPQLISHPPTARTTTSDVQLGRFIMRLSNSTCSATHSIGAPLSTQANWTERRRDGGTHWDLQTASLSTRSVAVSFHRPPTSQASVKKSLQRPLTATSPYLACFCCSARVKEIPLMQ